MHVMRDSRFCCRDLQFWKRVREFLHRPNVAVHWLGTKRQMHVQIRSHLLLIIYCR